MGDQCGASPHESHVADPAACATLRRLGRGLVCALHEGMRPDPDRIPRPCEVISEEEQKLLGSIIKFPGELPAALEIRSHPTGISIVRVMYELLPGALYTEVEETFGLFLEPITNTFYRKEREAEWYNGALHSHGSWDDKEAGELMEAKRASVEAEIITLLRALEAPTFASYYGAE
jgi:hypothetical protein